MGMAIPRYLRGLMMEVSCLMMVVEWIDDGGWLLDDSGWVVGWVDDGGWVGCVESMRER